MSGMRKTLSFLAAIATLGVLILVIGSLLMAVPPLTDMPVLVSVGILILMLLLGIGSGILPRKRATTVYW